MSAEGPVHPDCRNASNPYHECTEYCFKIIAEAKKNMNDFDSGSNVENGYEFRVSFIHGERTKDATICQIRTILKNSVTRMISVREDKFFLRPHEDNEQAGSIATSNHREDPNVKQDGGEDQSGEEGGFDGESDEARNFANLTGRQKKLFELRMKMNEARKANQTAMVAEKKKLEAPTESRGISKQKWLDERKKKIGKLLDANGLDMTKAYMLDTQEMAELKYKKWEKEPAPAGWDVFNQKTLYKAYKNRTKNIDVDLDEYNRMKEADPEFYRQASSLQYGKTSSISDEKIERMIKELNDREQKSRSFSRRRKFREEKDIDSINDRNEHFNKKIERAFGKYTLEIKNNLERGTALPD